MRHFLLAAALLSLPFTSFSQTDCGWNPDANGDYLIGISDLLGLLGLFSVADSDQDGIWDSEDDCFGVVDACGVCGGPGMVVTGMDVVTHVDSAFIEELNAWFVYQIGADTTYTYACPVPGCTDSAASNYNPEANVDDGTCLTGPAACGGASTVTYFGYDYDLVAIGEQCWFAENLRTTQYRNGDALYANVSDLNWTNATAGAQAIYGEGAAMVGLGNTDPDENLANHGRLYNGYAVMDARGLCPTGFHVPSDADWQVMEVVIGIPADEVGGEWYRGTTQGTELKVTSTHVPSWNGTDDWGFHGTPGGNRYNTSGWYSNEGYLGSWWSSTSIMGWGFEMLWYRVLSLDYAGVYRGAYAYEYGMSVRCVMD